MTRRAPLGTERGWTSLSSDVLCNCDRQSLPYIDGSAASLCSPLRFSQARSVTLNTRLPRVLGKHHHVGRTPFVSAPRSAEPATSRAMDGTIPSHLSAIVVPEMHVAMCALDYLLRPTTAHTRSTCRSLRTKSGLVHERQTAGRNHPAYAWRRNGGYDNVLSRYYLRKEERTMPRCTVLLIEQDPSLQVLYSDVLRNAGYDVYEITHDDDIVHMANTCQPAIALISGGRRGLFHAGWQAAEQLSQVHPMLPLVMIATNSVAISEVGQTPRGLSFVAALQKPFTLNALLATVARYSSQPTRNTRDRT